MNLAPITSEEIAYAEQILLPKGAHFDPERRRFIQELNSVDVQACPGSGKTTVLLAKLLILANRQPFPDNRGICVLTHTNVAINEIKHRLGIAGQRLFTYPNHFGTIQSFIDKFLAIPSFVLYRKFRPIRIDNEIYENTILKEYEDKHWAFNFVYQKNPRDPESAIKSIRHRFDSSGYLKLKKSFNDNGFYCGEGTQTYKNIDRIKKSILNNGILHFDDAYNFAFRYLEKFPELKNVFSQRFAFLFLDEMQDTEQKQVNILEKVFDESKIIIQRIGDKNQAIFQNKPTEICWNVKPNNLSITGSKRFHNSIASIIKNVSIEANNPLVGNQTVIPVFPPTIIVYGDDTIQNVIPHFGQLIFNQNIHTLGKEVFKAVGWIKEKETLCIKSYWHEYSKKPQSQKIDFNTLTDYLIHANKLNAVGCFNQLIKIFLKVLRIIESKHQKNGKEYYYSKNTLQSFLKYSHPIFYDNFRVRLSTWIRKIKNAKNVSSEIRDFIIQDFSLIFDFPANHAPLNEFLTSTLPSEQSVGVNDKVSPHNIFKVQFSENESVDIQVNTIHGVKGETHTATLYLETFYYKFEGQRLLDFLKGNYNQEKANQAHTKANLKMAYVGMSRPTHFLCVAIHQDRISGHESDLENNGWTIDNSLINQ